MPHALSNPDFRAGLFSLSSNRILSGRFRSSLRCSSGLVRDQPLPLKPRGCSALTAASTLVFRGVVHTKVNAVVLFCFIDKKIFQHVLPVCWGERFFADSALNQAAQKLGIRTHTNKLVACCASWAHEIGSFSHDGP